MGEDARSAAVLASMCEGIGDRKARWRLFDPIGDTVIRIVASDRVVRARPRAAQPPGAATDAWPAS